MSLSIKFSIFQATEFGMKTAYQHQDVVRQYIKELMALPNLPPTHIAPAFNRLRDARPDTAHNESMTKLLAYLQKTWIESRMCPPASWSTYKRAVRTNNDVEGWHARLNSRTEGNPNLYVLVRRLYEEAEDLPIQVRMVAQGQVLRRTSTVAKSKAAALFRLWQQYDDKEIRTSAFLRECGKHADHKETTDE